MEIDLTQLTPDVRYLDDVRMVLANQEVAKTIPNTELYFMYRGIEEKNGIRYDITVVPPHRFGNEFVKTKGHYHMGNYGEIYTVLEGEAIYVMQKRKAESENEIEDVYAVHAKKGDVVIIPSNYGHITINASDKELKMANWVASACMSDYSLFEKYQGGCWYYTQEGWVKNEKYQEVPELRFEEPTKEVPQDLEFLKKP